MKDHPKYYTKTGLEPITVIETWGLGFNLGNVLKYISRAGVKDPDTEIEDLEKARWYLDREISNRLNAQKLNKKAQKVNKGKQKKVKK